MTSSDTPSVPRKTRRPATYLVVTRGENGGFADGETFTTQEAAIEFARDSSETNPETEFIVFKVVGSALTEVEEKKSTTFGHVAL